MPQQRNRVSYPCTTSTRDKRGKLIHRHKTSWLNAIVTQRGERRMYIKSVIPGVGEVVIWIAVPVADAMIQFLVDETGKPLRGLQPQEKRTLYGLSAKDKGKAKGLNTKKHG